jgi:putative thioredoxin
MFNPHHTSDHVTAVDVAEFDSQVLGESATRPVLVDFWADWCGPCHALTPHLQRVVDELNGAVLLAKVEVDEGDNMKLAGHYRVRGFPTVILFRNGDEHGRFSGSRSSHWLREWLVEHLG